jgi:RNA polymerase sigma-70 factor (ECF subfamily)
VTGDSAAVFDAQRGRLFGLAYRLLGSASDAEDVLQDAFLRWAAADRDAIAEPAAWLTRAVTNLCLTELASARVRRERYTGTWLPEPLLTNAGGSAGMGTAVVTGAGVDPGPLETAAQRESVSMALLLLCEQLTAAERAVFILREAFGYRYGEIAGIIGRSEAACRQLGHRAAVRLRAESRHARFTPADPDEAARWRQLTSQFLAAAVAGDVAGLERFLSDDVVSWSDGGGAVPAGLRPVYGRAKVARLFAALGPALAAGPALAGGPGPAAGPGVTPALVHALGGKLRGGLATSEADVNGSPGLLIWADGELFSVYVPVIEGAKITALYTIAAPDKLAVAGRQARASRNAALPSQ